MLLPRVLVLLILWLAGTAWADEAAEVQRLMRAGELPAALERAERASAADAGDAKLRFLTGVILMDLKRDADALTVFERLTEDFPELAEPYNNIALLQARAGKLDEARAALETALRNDPSLRAARINLGDVYLRLAVRAWETVAAEAPGDAGLQRRLRAAREILAQPR
jgi:tetratricopeptide (TPR) repeat protein